MTDFPKILAIETATRHQALALLDGETLLEHRIQRVRYNHGSSLLDNIDRLFAAQSLTLSDVDLFAVGLGPGSFTGLRVGLATAKALARAKNKPIVGVSSLAALAYIPARTNPGALVAASIDARRREVYAGAYRFTDRLEAILPDRAISPADWIDDLSPFADEPLLQVGEGPESYEALREWQPPGLIALSFAQAPPSALAIALLGRRKALQEGADDLVALEPNYIRPSDARLPAKPLRDLPELKELQELQKNQNRETSS